MKVNGWIGKGQGAMGRQQSMEEGDQFPPPSPLPHEYHLNVLGESEERNGERKGNPDLLLN